MMNLGLALVNVDIAGNGGKTVLNYRTAFR